MLPMAQRARRGLRPAMQGLQKTPRSISVMLRNRFSRPNCSALHRTRRGAAFWFPPTACAGFVTNKDSGNITSPRPAAHLLPGLEKLLAPRGADCRTKVLNTLNPHRQNPANQGSKERHRMQAMTPVATTCTPTLKNWGTSSCTPTLKNWGTSTTRPATTLPRETSRHLLAKRNQRNNRAH